VPYGVYYNNNKRLGSRSDRITTRRFAVTAIAPLVEGHGKKRYPNPRSLLVPLTRGSNGYRVRL